MGDLDLDFEIKEGNLQNYSRSLNLNNAVSTVSFEIDGIAFTRESFISFPDGVMVIKLAASEKGKVSFAADLASKLKIRNKQVEGNQIVLQGKAPKHVAHRESEPEQDCFGSL